MAKTDWTLDDVVMPDDMNELGDKANKVGDLSKLDTTGKTNLVVAVNEINTLAKNAIPKADKGKANGIATLDGDGKIPIDQIPAGAGDPVLYTPTSVDVVGSYNPGTSSPHPAMTSNSQAGFTLSTSNGSSNIYVLFDKNTGGSSYTSSNVPHWTQLKMDIPRIINKYGFYTGQVADGYQPKDYYLEASNDGTNWTILDTRLGQIHSGYTTVLWDVNNTTPYLYYRQRVTACRSQSYFILYEMYFYEALPLYKTQYSVNIPGISSLVNGLKVNIKPNVTQRFEEVYPELKINSLPFKPIKGDVLIANKPYELIYDSSSGTWTAKEFTPNYPLIKWEQYAKNLNNSVISYILNPSSQPSCMVGSRIYYLSCSSSSTTSSNTINVSWYDLETKISGIGAVWTAIRGYNYAVKSIHSNPNNRDELVIVYQLTDNDYGFGVLKYVISTNSYIVLNSKVSGFLNAGNAYPSCTNKAENTINVWHNNGSNEKYYHKIDLNTGTLLARSNYQNDSYMNMYFGSMFGIDVDTLFTIGTSQIGISASPAGGVAKYSLLPSPPTILPTNFSYDFILYDETYVIMLCNHLKKMIIYDTVNRIFFERPGISIPLGTGNSTLTYVSTDGYIYRLHGTSSTLYFVFRVKISDIVKNIGTALV